MINRERLYQNILELGNIGKDAHGGVTRFPYTDVDEEAKTFIIKKMKEANLLVRIDAVGNIIGTRQGQQDRKVLCGSHYDTVKNGGNFDGCLGVLGAIEVLHTMYEQNLCLPDSIEVIACKDEEGNRFRTGMVGSRAICSTLDAHDLHAVDEQGITLQQAAKKQGYAVEQYETCAYDFEAVKAYVELHIEQGSVLEKHELAVGVVKGIAGLQRFMITIFGRSGHSGATPMMDRVDPVVAFSKLSIYMNEQIKSYQDAVVTIGEIHTYPGACNIICDHISFSLDIRSLCMSDIQDFMKHIHKFLLNLKHLGFTYQVQETQRLEPAICDKTIQSIMCEHMKKTYHKSFSMMSGAGHDAMNFYGKCPIGMIFVRSKHGYSHCPEEYSSLEDCGEGADFLYQTLVSISSIK